MKYELETIPVWDAYHAEDECPLCLLQRKAERDFVRFYVGHSVMVPEMRVQVNDSGFCPAHFPMLLEGGNRLGLALITHTHVGELRRKLERRLGKGKAGAALKREIAGFDAFLSQQLDRCLICERLDDRFKRYSYTIVHLWRHENEFRQAFNVSRGICLDHVRGPAGDGRGDAPGRAATGVRQRPAGGAAALLGAAGTGAADLHRQVRLPRRGPSQSRRQAVGRRCHPEAHRRRRSARDPSLTWVG